MKNIFDLQYFAYDPQAQPASNTGAHFEDGQSYPAYNDLTAEMKTFYDMTLIDEAGPELVHEQFAQKKPIPKGSGKKIEFRKYSPLAKALTPLTEGVTPDGKKLNVEKIEATVNQYGDFIPLTDMLELTAIDNNIVEAVKLLGKQSGLTMDTVVRNVLQSGTNVSYASKWSGETETEVEHRYDLDRTSKLTVDTIEKVVAKLRSQNAPMINGQYVAIIHPYVAYDLRRDKDFIEAHKYASPEELYNGELGSLAGVRFVQSSEAKIYRGADLTATARNLTVAASSTTTVIKVSETLEANALVGREVLIGSEHAVVASNTTSAITLESALSSAPSASTVVYPGEAGAEGISVYGCLFMGAEAYGTTEITGGGLETIVKQKGSSGTADPLNQRSTVGWKGTKTAEILVENYLVRVECASKFADQAAN